MSNVLFINQLKDGNGNLITQFITNIPPVTIKIISESKLLNKNNTTNGLYVLETDVPRSQTIPEIEKFLKSRPDTENLEKNIGGWLLLIFGDLLELGTPL
jgi:hypothetical protein